MFTPAVIVIDGSSGKGSIGRHSDTPLVLALVNPIVLFLHPRLHGRFQILRRVPCHVLPQRVLGTGSATGLPDARSLPGSFLCDWLDAVSSGAAASQWCRPRPGSCVLPNHVVSQPHSEPGSKLRDTPRTRHGHTLTNPDKP